MPFTAAPLGLAQRQVEMVLTSRFFPCNLSDTMIVYRYFGKDKIWELEEERMYFTQPKYFNDPFDFRPTIAPTRDGPYLRGLESQTRDEVILWFSNNPTIDDPAIAADQFMEKLRPQLIKHLARQMPKTQASVHEHLSTVAVAVCYTERKNLRLMWSYYGESHKGFVVAYDSENQLFKGLGGTLGRIKYQVARPLYDPSSDETQPYYIIKHSVWRHERELRLLDLAERCQKDDRNNMMRFYKRFPQEGIKSIYIGANAADTLIERMKGLRSVKSGQVKLFYGHPHPSKSNIVFKTFPQK